MTGLHADATMYRMIWRGDASSIDLEADATKHKQLYPELQLQPLQSQHAEQAVALHV